MPVAIKTLGPLHIEDLEPHRFEDLIRQLLYDFRDWNEIEATGRSGSDESSPSHGIIHDDRRRVIRMDDNAEGAPRRSQEPSKHHYIPEFYLRGWAGADGRLERYDRPVPNKVMARRVFPSEVGFERDLYRYPDDNPAKAAWLETGVFQRIDDLAAPVLRKLNAEPPAQLTVEARSAWTVFIRALFYRTPAALRAVKQSAAHDWRKAAARVGDQYDAMRAADDPATLEEYIAQYSALDIERSILRVLPSIFVGEKIGQVMNDLHMRIIITPSNVPAFLISDDFIIRTNGITVPGGHFAIPISPRRLVVMAWEKSKLEEIVALQPSDLVSQINRWTVERVRYFVGAVDRSQDRFIRNRFGANLKEPLFTRRKETGFPMPNRDN